MPRWNDWDYQRTFMQAGLDAPSYDMVQGLKGRDIDPEDAVAAIVLYVAGGDAHAWPLPEMELQAIKPVFSVVHPQKAFEALPMSPPPVQGMAQREADRVLNEQDAQSTGCWTWVWRITAALFLGFALLSLLAAIIGT